MEICCKETNTALDLKKPKFRLISASTEPKNESSKLVIEEIADPASNKKLYKCPFKDTCKRTFREKGNLKTHMRIHTGERPFVCTFTDCTKSFITLGNLKSHLANHTGEKPFACSFPGCDKKYSRVCRLKIHKRTHNGERPFKCTFYNCGKEFNEKGNLKTHVRIHTGEKPYICDFEGCRRSFKAHGHLKDHLKRHYNIKPFTCKICSAKFARASTLKIHNNTHTGEKPHLCPFEKCGRKFAEKGNLRTHIKTHHKSSKLEETLNTDKPLINENCNAQNSTKSENTINFFNKERLYSMMNLINNKYLYSQYFINMGFFNPNNNFMNYMNLLSFQPNININNLVLNYNNLGIDLSKSNQSDINH